MDLTIIRLTAGRDALDDALTLIEALASSPAAPHQPNINPNPNPTLDVWMKDTQDSL